MTALAGDLDFVGTGIAAPVAAKLLAGGHGAQTGFVSTRLLLFISHSILLKVLLDAVVTATLIFAFFRSSIGLDDEATLPVLNLFLGFLHDFRKSASQFFDAC